MPLRSISASGSPVAYRTEVAARLAETSTSTLAGTESLLNPPSRFAAVPKDALQMLRDGRCDALTCLAVPERRHWPGLRTAGSQAVLDGGR